MIRTLAFFFCSFLFCNNISGQTSNSLTIQDTRQINELPNFAGRVFRADFKSRSGLGVPGSGFYSTNLTIAPWATNENSGDKNHQLNFNNGGIFYRQAYPLDAKWGAWYRLLMADENGDFSADGSLTIIRHLSQTRSHIYFGNGAPVSGKSSAILCFGGYGIQNAVFNWVPNTSIDQGKLFLSFGGSDNGDGHTEKMTFQSNGNVGIGTTAPDSKLTVAGNIHAREVKVTADAGRFPDYVFANDYKLKSLQEVEEYIKQNSHLPEIPSAKEIEANGLMLAEMNMNLLKKIEELTLYMIEQNKEVKELREENKILKSLSERLSDLEAEVRKK